MITMTDTEGLQENYDIREITDIEDLKDSINASIREIEVNFKNAGFRNNSGDVIKAIAAALQDNKFTFLRLNYLHDAMGLIADALKANTSLAELELHDCNPETFKIIADALKMDTSLVELGDKFDGLNIFSNETAKNNTTLLYFYLDGRDINEYLQPQYLQYASYPDALLKDLKIVNERLEQNRCQRNATIKNAIQVADEEHNFEFSQALYGSIQNNIQKLPKHFPGRNELYQQTKRAKDIRQIAAPAVTVENEKDDSESVQPEPTFRQ
jgi:hypothetical protein